MANYLILSCDGGGIRGYLSSLLLKKLNDDLGIFGNNNQNINLYAGTSTGGLIALALASGKSIDSIVDLYATKGDQIFNPLGVQLHCLLPEGAPGATAGLSDIKGLLQVLYDDIGDPSPLTVLQNFVPNPLLSSLNSNVMVTTFQLSDGANPPSWNPLVIDNFPGSAGSGTYLYDAALSTSAAPVYFPPYLHPQFGWCSDGGLYANNPSAVAVGLAIQAANQQLSNIVLLSIGTGVTASAMQVTPEFRLCYGLKNWAWFESYGPTPPFAILNALMDGASISNDALTKSLLGDNYMRVNPTLPESVPLDDYSPEVLKMFRDVADEYFASQEWAAVEAWVKSKFLGNS